MGLGPARVIALTQAKRRALAGQRLILDAIDPAKARKAERCPAAMTFAECAKKYVEAHKAGWKNGKHIAQWTSTLETCANPAIGKRPVDQVDADHVFKILEPIWTTKTETPTPLPFQLLDMGSRADQPSARNHRSQPCARGRERRGTRPQAHRLPGQAR